MEIIKTKKNIRKFSLKAFSYVEVLVAMVIISGVFTAFIDLAYQSVHKAKVLEQRDLMENYAIVLLEDFTDAVASNENFWTSTNGRYYLSGTGDNNKDIILNQNCKLLDDGNYLSYKCTNVNNYLGSAVDNFAYFIDVVQTAPNIKRLTVVVGCFKNSRNVPSCKGEELKPVKIEKFIVNYGQNK